MRNGDSGSSPHARGTSSAVRLVWASQRFIPARTGNICRSERHSSGQPVHPRTHGEHTMRDLGCFGYGGSSPHARGTSDRATQLNQPLRFIPARTGNIQSQFTKGYHHAVHPRTHGEHKLAPTAVPSILGSSPHARGTCDEEGSLLQRWRFIPARTGNIMGLSGKRWAGTVHPRTHGEH